MTRKNIELAQVRVNARLAGVQEIYRFQSQEQGDQREVAAAEAALEQARVAFNQLLGVELTRRWLPEEVSLTVDDPHFGSTAGGVTPMILNQALLDRFRDYSVQLALAAAPELKALDKAIEAQRLVLNQKRRRFFVPSVALQFEYAQTYDRDPAFSGPDDMWSAGLAFSLPLFEGGGRVHDARMASTDLVLLQTERANSVRRLEERTRQVFYQIESSYPTIAYSEKAKELAEQNLDVVTYRYQQGEAAVIDLLDAQNAFFVQRQNEALANYQTVIDLVRFQRSIAWFEFMSSQEERLQWVDALRQHLGLPATESNDE